MKAFVFTAPSLPQDIVLKGGNYAFQAKVLSASKKYAFSLLINGVWVKFDSPTQTTNWRLITHKFSFEGLATKFLLSSDYATAGVPIKVLEPQLEEGSFFSTPRVNELDTLEVIQNAKIEAQEASKAYVKSQEYLTSVELEAWKDGIITEAEQGAIDEAQALVSAQAALDLAARNALQETLEAYSDGVVTREELARLTDVSEALQDAKDFANAIKNDFDLELQKFTDDNLLSTYEKPEVKRELDEIDAEKSTMEAQAVNAGVSHIAYTAAYTALKNYLTPLLANMATDSVIVSVTYLNNFKNYYTAKINLAKSITDKLKAEIVVVDGNVSAINGRLTAEEQKIIDILKKTNVFDSVTIDTVVSLIMSKTMMVGNGSIANAGLDGRDTANDATRIWSGADYAGRNTANWRMRDDGVEEQWFNGVKVRERGVVNGNYVDRFFNPADGLLAKQTAIIDGFITEEWYKNGILVYRIGNGGIYYVSEVAHSWNTVYVKFLTATAIQTDTQLAVLVKSILKFQEYRQTPFGDYVIVSLNAPSTAYRFSAGRNVYSESNLQYEKYFYADNSSGNVPYASAPKIADGWYVGNFENKSNDMPSGGGTTSYSFSVQCIRIAGGEVAETKSVLISGTYRIPPYA